MDLKKMSSKGVDLMELRRMHEAMEELLSKENARAGVAELCDFQGSDGSFALIERRGVPREAIIDFVNMPTYIGTAVLMRAYLAGNAGVRANLEKGLQYSAETGFMGHGYEAETALIQAMNIFIKGGLKEFLEKERELCPSFHVLVRNTLYGFEADVKTGKTKGFWGEDYMADWSNILNELKTGTKLYMAYGSNMNHEQMKKRCPDAKPVGKTYLRDWKLEIPFHANIEPEKGAKTPVFIWEITEADEKILDGWEGFPKAYFKREFLVELEGKKISVMAYVMTEEHKNSGNIARAGYLDTIKQGYSDCGFDISELKF